MSKKSIFAKMRRNGTLVRVNDDGSEEPMPVTPLAPRTEQEIEAAALADPDAQPLRDADFKRMRRVPQVKTLRRTLGLTQEEFAARYQIPLGTEARLGAGKGGARSTCPGLPQSHRARS
jgi:putative transcriptional regulator